MRVRACRALFACVLLAAVSGVCRADLIALTPKLTTSTYFNFSVHVTSNYTYGWQFVVGAQDLTVTKLGLADQTTAANDVFGGASIGNSVQTVAIYDCNTKTVLAQVAIDPSSDPLSNCYFWHSASATLLAGKTYWLETTTKSGQNVFSDYTVYGNASGLHLQFDPNVIVTHTLGAPYVQTGTNVLTTPTGIDNGNNGLWGVYDGNFQFAAVPEPCTLLLVGSGVIGATGWIRRRGMNG